MCSPIIRAGLRGYNSSTKQTQAPSSLYILVTKTLCLCEITSRGVSNNRQGPTNQTKDHATARGGLGLWRRETKTGRYMWVCVCVYVYRSDLN